MVENFCQTLSLVFLMELNNMLRENKLAENAVETRQAKIFELFDEMHKDFSTVFDLLETLHSKMRPILTDNGSHSLLEKEQAIPQRSEIANIIATNNDKINGIKARLIFLLDNIEI